MHLHTLRLSAIGPFPGEHVIDFAELGSGGIFLLEGPTGAGKSTIIDAIVFALYGKVASKDASEDRLRSSYVGPEVESSVDLVFETGHGIYRILRRPAYDRPSKRGTGTVRQNMQVQLWRLTSLDSLGDGDQLSTRADEVGVEVARLVGLTRDQFIQTIVLPQGEFANFLGAKPEDRRHLLQRVFGTEIYDRIQAELVEARKQANQRLTEAKSRIRSAVDTFSGAAELPHEDCEQLAGLVAEGETEVLTSAVNAVVETITQEAAAATVAATSAATEAGVAENSARSAAALLGSARERADLTDRFTALSRGSDEHTACVQKHQLAIKAGQVSAFLSACTRAAHTLGSANEDLVEALASAHWLDWKHLDGAQGLHDWHRGQDGPVPGIEVLHQPAAKPTLDLSVEISSRQERLTGLNRAADLEARLPERVEEFTARTSALADRERSRTDLATALETRPVERQEVDDERVAASRRADAAEDLSEQVRRAKDAHENAMRADAVGSEIADLDGEIVAARAAALDAEAALSRLRRARIDGIAGELATALLPGEPCVVCGATDHPAPAALSDDHASEDQIIEAEETARTHAQTLSDLAGARGELTAAHARHLAAAGERSGREALEVVRELELELATATAARRDLQGLAAKLAAFDATTAQMQAKLKTEEAWLAREAAELRALSAAISADRTEIREAIAAADPAQSPAEAMDTGGQGANATHLIEQLTQQIEALSTLTEALAARQRALAEVDRAREEASNALDANGFTDADHARAASLTPTDLENLNQRIKAHEAERTLVTSGLAQERITQLDPELTVEQAEIDAELAHKLSLEAKTYSEEAGRLASQREDARKRARTTAHGISGAIAASAALLDELAPTLRIANLVDATSSDNTKALTLGTYVLTRRFEEVLGAANGRLREMSSGRYELVRSSEKESHGGRRLGLALKIIDHNTGSHRDPATLSGGETFYVSLCLALGLADIVTAEAGGVDLGTLFVDEGFGSLDPETLDLVMAELAKLRSGGRMVGVVSHVEAMKSTISDRISVRRRSDGSSTLSVLAGTR